MPTITASAPVLLVRDVAASARYYQECIGFHGASFHGEPPTFCILAWGDFYLMLAQADADKIIPFWKIRDKTCNAYFWVNDADALHAEMKARGARIDYGPCTQSYGVREFGIQDLDEHDISFGQVLK
ncbi:MAG: hypothetical protein QOE70_3587 [Chthoniobacter sp.]|jgi:catechol 2,3-dioxygenase-like lactoylglutathione lyase family enzyme|nr:hypothetical protein [Chthoniobacter sp.]